MDALLEPFAALQTLHDEMTAIEHRLGEASPAEVAALRRAAGALPARRRLRPRVARAPPHRRRRLHRDRPRPLGRRRCRAASAAGSSWRRCWCASPTCCCSTSRPTTWISRPSNGSRAFLAEYPGRVRAGLARPRLHPRRLPRDGRARERQVRPLPVRLRQVRRRARRAPRARARRVRAPEGARRQDRGLHPAQPGRAEDQAGAEPAQDAGEAGPPRAPRGPLAVRRQDRPVVLDRRRPRQQGDDPRAAHHRRLSRTRHRSCATSPSTSTAATRSASWARTAPASRRC